MKRNAKVLLSCILFAIFAIGILGIAIQKIGYEQSDAAKSKAIEIADIPPFTTTFQTTAMDITEETLLNETVAQTTAQTEETVEVDEYAALLLQTDIESLTEVNEDVFGFIVIPDSTVSYPLLQGDDNTHYLNYAWDGSRNAGGAIYLDYRNARDFSDFHSIIYGHRMYSDAMFNSLKYYSDVEYLKTHPSVYIVTADKVLRYDAFAAYDADAINGHSYRLGLKDTYGMQAYINYCLKNSVIDSGISPSAENEDKVLTLSTCSEDGSEKTRWVVHFVLAYETKRNEF